MSNLTLQPNNSDADFGGPEHCQNNETIASILEISRIYSSIMHNETLANGIKLSYRNLLRPLAIKDGVTQLQLAQTADLKAPTVSTILRNMEIDGLITRETDINDARVTRVYITEKGIQADLKMRKSIEKVSNIFLQNVSSEEQDLIINILNKMKGSIK